MEPEDDKTRGSTLLSKGMLVHHYRILEKIGAGGMCAGRGHCCDKMEGSKGYTHGVKHVLGRTSFTIGINRPPTRTLLSSSEFCRPGHSLIALQPKHHKSLGKVRSKLHFPPAETFFCFGCMAIKVIYTAERRGIPRQEPWISR